MCRVIWLVIEVATTLGNTILKARSTLQSITTFQASVHANIHMYASTYVTYRMYVHTYVHMYIDTHQQHKRGSSQGLYKEEFYGLFEIPWGSTIVY